MRSGKPMQCLLFMGLLFRAVVDGYRRWGVKKSPRGTRHMSLKYANADFMDQNARAQLLFAHNALRSLVSLPAANMLFMVWSDELEFLAMKWVQQCQWGQDPELLKINKQHSYSLFSSVGQNKFALDLESMKNFSVGVRKIVGEWSSEKASYYFNSPRQYCSYKECGNYTQIVWARSLYLGCASHVCDHLNGNEIPTPAQLVVCNYGPGGNIEGEPPYIIGASCSKCPSGFSQCVDNLCEALPRCKPVTDCKPKNMTTCLCDESKLTAASRRNDGSSQTLPSCNGFLFLMLTISIIASLYVFKT